MKRKDLREYRIWKAMRARCNAPCMRNLSYQKKGIKVCERWNSFTLFMQDMGACPEGYTIDRIDNNKDYEPSNCRWADFSTQARNRGKFNLMFTMNGKTQCLKDWAKEYNVNYQTLVMRLKRGKGTTIQELLEYVDDRDKPFEWEGKLYTRKELCEKYGISLSMFYDRWHKGWTLERILTTPKQL